MGAAECKGCSTSDPTSDTVQVNATLLADAGGKAAAASPVHEKAQSIEDQRLQREAEEQRAREAAAEEERQRREAEEERRRREAEAEKQARMEREQAEERERIAREEQERAARELEAQERAAVEEAARRVRQEEEQARRAEEARLAAELEAAKEKVATFLKVRGFTKGIVAAKKSCMKTSYPLHVAVEENSAEMVVALVKCGADKAAKNSAGLTPLALAQKLDQKKRAHSAVLAALA